MVQQLPGGYVFDPADPRAPTDDQWAAMTPAERARVVAMLPAEVPWELMPPEGDAHREAKERARAAEEQARAAEERAADLERQLREAQAEIARLKGGSTA
ncbi:hypothetical protein ACMHYB_22665 [Sorangium sp. So ce1128]